MLIIVANTVAVSVVVGAVYLVSALIQMKKTVYDKSIVHKDLDMSNLYGKT
ncbi:MAG: hypothetical protein LE178_01090 [Endomicrobium sp.]|nr:hypothetical protein [Endomicrobium sp.]